MSDTTGSRRGLPVDRPWQVTGNPFVGNPPSHREDIERD